MTPSTSSGPTGKTNAWVALACICLVLAGIGIATHAWTQALNQDESLYYAPAINFVSRSIPVFPLHDYPFPGPPLGLWIQAIVAKFFGGFTSVRVLSSVCAAALAAYLLLLSPARKKFKPLAVMALLSFPFLLWNDYTLKQHAFFTACLLIGLDRWCLAEEASFEAGTISTGVFFTMAILTNQFCAPLCAALSLDGMLRMRSFKKIDMARILPTAVPLACLALLMLYWGGMQPRSYVDPYPAIIGMGWRIKVAQWMLGLLCVGVWPGLLTFNPRLHGKAFAIAILPCVGLVWASNLYAAEGPYTEAKGLVSVFLIFISHSYPALSLFLAGSLAALGIAFWISPGLDAVWSWRCRLMIASHLAVNTLFVRYLFESYYMVLVLSLLFLTFRNNTVFATNQPRTKIGPLVIISVGTVCTVLKLLQPPG